LLDFFFQFIPTKTGGHPMFAFPWSRVSSRPSILTRWVFLVIAANWLSFAADAKTSVQDAPCPNTPLINAIHNRDAALAVRLIHEGADLDAEPCGVSALAEAIVYDDSRVVEELLDKVPVRTCWTAPKPRH
jgi:hypothetical protein